VNVKNGFTLPAGWIRTTIGEVSEVNKRNPALRDYADNMLVTFVPMAAVDADTGTIISPQIRPLGEVRKGFTPFSNGDVIVAKITPSMENGKAAIAKDLHNGIGFGSTEFHVMSPKSIVLPSYLFYFIRQESFRWDAKANFAGTAGQLRVPSSFVEHYPIPLPPLPEQECIVARIESLFTQLDAGVSALKRARAALKRYKASVLKAACEGRLVQGDIARHGRGGSALSGEIDLPDSNLSGPAALPEIETRPHYNAGEVELPEGWRWARVEELNPPNRKCAYGVLQPGGDKPNGVLFVRVGDVNEGVIDLQNLKRIDPTLPINIQEQNCKGRSLITLVGAIGRTALCQIV
jgi:type I restriction enzyme S subunit